jgi:DNA invertase Pin-like site-specific DNA recombinase
MVHHRRKKETPTPPTPGWAIYLRTSSDESQKPELSRARQRFLIQSNVLERSELPVIDEYIDVLTGKTPRREGYQRLLQDARVGKFSHVIVERADRFGRNDTEALRAIDELHEFGVAVRFANSPDLDPMDPDDRVIVALSLTLARRESALLGIRVKGGLQAKRQSGGYINRAPDGYKNVMGQTDLDKKKDLGRFHRWIELDPERARVWREAWDLLLTDRLTLAEIAEALHAKGYRHQSGRPFVELKANGKRIPAVGTLSHTFHNWTYAGWIVSERHCIPPKTLRGNWEPLVTTEAFERGLDILVRRNQHRIIRCKQAYLLTGLVFFQPADDGHLIRLTGSTSNARRAGGGTAYYRIAAAGAASFLCREIDARVAAEIQRIQVDPDLLPLIRSAYTYELQQKLGGGRPEERTRLQAALKAIAEEETRMARLLAAGKISEEVWEGLWAEWQDRRHQTRRALDMLEQQHATHVENLDAALQIIAKIGVLYNGLERGDQKELLRHVLERVVVKTEGTIHLELRAPFAYLKELTDEIRIVEARQRAAQEKQERSVKQNGGQCLNLIRRFQMGVPVLADVAKLGRRIPAVNLDHSLPALDRDPF